MITIAYHADLDEVQSLPRLAALSEAQAAPFERLAWWQGLAGECAMAPLVAVAEDGEGLAVLALATGAKRLEALANWYNFRWRPLASPDADAPALFTALAADLAKRTKRTKRTKRITLEPLLGADAALLAPSFRAAGWVVEQAACGTNHWLEVRGRDFATYLSTRPGPLRTTLARKRGRLTVEIVTRFDAATYAAYEAVYAESWKPSEGSPAFLRRFAEAEGAGGRLRLGIARAGDEVAAAQLWSVEGDTAFIHKLAHRETAKALSPGTVLTAALLQHVIDRDHVREVDFGTGDEPYKRDWMEASRPLHRLDMFRPEAPSLWPHIARERLRRLAGAGGRG